MATFARPLDAPFFEGSDTAPAGIVPWVLPCSIGSHPYMIDFSKYRRTTLQIRRLGTDDSVEPGESTLNASGVWPRGQDNFFLGCGQKFLDNRFAFESVYVHSGEYPSVRTRFWQSLGVNPWNEGLLTLHNEYASASTTTLGMLTVACGNYLYFTKANKIWWVLSPTPGTFGSPTQVTSSFANTITSITSDGSRVWVATGTTGVFVTVAGSTTCAAAATPAALTSPQGLAQQAGVGTVNATNLPNGSTTWYVSAVDAFGNETASTSVAATVASLPIELTWNANANASSFNVYRGTGTLVINVDTPSYTDDGSIAGTAQTRPTTNGTGASAYPATFVLFAKSSLVASTGRDLVQILASGSTQFIWEHENPSFVFTCGCEFPQAIIVGGYAGGLSYIGAIQPDAQTVGATLAPPTWATTLPLGETINSIAYAAGSVLMGTSQGIRSGTTPDSIGVFDVNPVVTAPGSVSCVAPWQQYMYFSWSNFNGTEPWKSRSTVSGLGRADLSQYVTSGVPAYATDVMSTETGTTTSFAVLNGTPYFVVLNSGTYSLWGPDGKFVASGYIEPGWIRYGTLEPKILVEVDFQCLPLNAGEAVDFSLSDEYSNLTDVGTLNTLGATTLVDPFQTGLQVGQRFQPILTLTAGTSQATTPTLVSWIAKAVVIPKRQDEILLPIIFATAVSSGQAANEVWAMDTWNEFLYLKGLEASGEPVQHQLGSDTHLVYVDQIMVGDDHTSMNDDRTWLNTTVTVKLLTLT